MHARQFRSRPVGDRTSPGTATASDDKIVLAGFSSDAETDLHIYLTSGPAESNVSAGRQVGVVASDKDSEAFSLGMGRPVGPYRLRDPL